MIIQLHDDCSTEHKALIRQNVEVLNYSANEVSTFHKNYLVCVGKSEFDIRNIGKLEGVEDVHRVTEANKLVSRQWKVKPTVIEFGNGIKIGEGNFVLMAGPCSIEGKEQVSSTLDFLSEHKIPFMRGGVYKPRSSPYSFRGLGMDGLKFWAPMARKAGKKIITEVMQVSQIEAMLEYVDVFQVGARNTQNFNLLDELGKVNKPVMLKRGMSTTLNEFLASAEYIFSNGNEQIILCERGIRTFENAYRNTLDLNSIPVLKDKTHLQVIVDPSHGIGLRKHVEPMALAGVMSGADGIIIEIHEEPEKAFSDADQTLSYKEAEKLVENARMTYELRGGLK